MKNIVLILFLFIISECLCAQGQNKKFGLEINQNFFGGGNSDTNESGFHFTYKINPSINLKLGWIYAYSRLYSGNYESNLSIGAGYQTSLKNGCDIYDLEIFSLFSNEPFGHSPFGQYNIDLGTKLIYKKLIFMNFGLRYDCDEWFVDNMKVTTNSLGFFSGFGIFLDFEGCSIKAAKRKNAN